jgi:hypothetical protein
MAAETLDPMVEGVKRILRWGGGPEVPASITSADLEALFLAELRNRRERLARWMRLIEDQVRREAVPPPVRSRSRRQCRSRCGRMRG